MAQEKAEDTQLHPRNSKKMATAAYTRQSTRKNKWNVDCGMYCVGKVEGGRKKEALAGIRTKGKKK